MKSVSYVIFTVLVFLFAPLTLAGCGAEGVEEVPQIAEEIKSMAIAEIEKDPMVKEAAIAQKGKKISLAIIVNYATSKEHAKRLGDNFVRLVKALSEDKSPGKEIGEGIYHYSISVCYPDETVVVKGAKVDFADHITW